MKKIFNLICTTALAGYLMVMFSCEDFLIKEPLGVMSELSMETPVGVEGLLISAYASMRGYYWEDGMVTDLTMDVASDDFYKGSTYGDGDSRNHVERWDVEPSNGLTNDRFEKSYFGVARANDVLESLWANLESDDPINQDRATEIEAEAKFLRAWFHFKAAKCFRYIPIILTQTELGDVLPEEVTNDTQGWDEIEADLQHAINNLSESKPLGEVGRIDKYGAMAIKAQVHLFQNEFDEAKLLLDNIINSGRYKLVDHYYDNYNMATENNEESIFEFQASTSATNYVSNPYGGPSTPQKGPAGVGWGFTQPSQPLFEAFQTNSDGLPIFNIKDRVHLAHDMGLSSTDEFHPTDHQLDPRVDYTIARRGVDYLGWGVFPGDAWIRDQGNGGPYMCKKFTTLYENRDLNLYGNGHHNGKNWRFYRYAHILLWRAEVAVEENDLEYARQLVNQIRKRAKETPVVMGKVSTYIFDASEPEVDWDKPAANYKIELYPEGSSAFSNKEEARKAVRMEMRLEFATEGMRFYDLRRWGIAAEVLTAYQERDIQFRPFLTGAKYNPERSGYWPLPLVQLDLLPALKQDPAYN